MYVCSVYIYSLYICIFKYIYICPHSYLRLTLIFKSQIDGSKNEEENPKNPTKPSRFALPSFSSFSSSARTINTENDVNEEEKILQKENHNDEVYSNYSCKSPAEGSSDPLSHSGSTEDGPSGVYHNQGKKSETVSVSKKELRGVVMDVVILGGPICSTVNYVYVYKRIYVDVFRGGVWYLCSIAIIIAITIVMVTIIMIVINILIIITATTTISLIPPPSLSRVVNGRVPVR